MNHMTSRCAKKGSWTSSLAAVSLLAVVLTALIGGELRAAEPTDPAVAANPNALIEESAQKMLQELDAHRAEYRKTPTEVYKLVDEILLPHFDTEYAARLVLGLHWRTATPEQRQRFIKAFYQSLLENYGTALLDFTADKLTVLPFRGDESADRATVRTEVRRSNGTRVPVNYSMHKTPQGWKAWDITIEGISYVRNFRNDFGTEIDQKGLDAVIQRLETQGFKAQKQTA
jgi:phospholipid transport system substrate-binding protein